MIRVKQKYLAFFPIFGGVLRTAAKNRKKCLMNKNIWTLLAIAKIFDATFNREDKKNVKKQSVSQMIDLVMTIRMVQESSKSELSSGIFGHVKVWLNFGCQRIKRTFRLPTD